MSDSAASFWSGVLIGIACSVLVLGPLSDHYWKTQAITHKAAHYEVSDQGVVKFVWNQ